MGCTCPAQQGHPLQHHQQQHRQAQVRLHMLLLLLLQQLQESSQLPVVLQLQVLLPHQQL
jgi:hypothetical protein